MTNKIIYFDMDGTLADLYSVDNVFKRLDSYDVGPYVEAKPINKYINLLKEYKNNGYTITILSCLSKITNDKYDKEVINAKGLWLDKYVGKEYIDERIYIFLIQKINQHMLIRKVYWLMMMSIYVTIGLWVKPL